MDIERELEILINKHKGKQVGVGEIRLDWFAEDCLKEIRRLKAEIARQSEIEMVVCPDCGGSGVYQEYDEYDRYHVYTCYKCEGTGEIARQSVKSEEVGRNNLLLVEIKHLVQTEDMDIWNYKNELISLLDEAIARQSATSEEVAEAIEYFEDIFTYIAGAPSEPKYRLAIKALQAYQPWIPCTERMPTEDDADEDGFVLTLDADRQQTDYPHSEIDEWNNRCDVKITHWRPMLPIPKGE